MATILVEMDKELAKEFSEVCEDLGLTVSTAINVFARKVARTWSIPFELCGDIPNERTIEAMREAEDILKNPDKYPAYHSIAEMNAALDAMEEEDDDEDAEV